MKLLFIQFYTFLFFVFLSNIVCGQQKQQMVRLAKLIIDSAQINSYKSYLREEIETSIKAEPGVLTLYPMFEKNYPTHLTILEIYADSAAYKTHLLTTHFIKYKTGTKLMVKSLELIAVNPLISEMKIKK